MRQSQSGLTLIEVIFAIALSAAVAVIGVRHLRQPGDTVRERSCDLRREVLQEQVDRYTEMTGRSPSRDLRELADPDYAGNVVPRCPVTDSGYQLRGDQVICPRHVDR